MSSDSVRSDSVSLALVNKVISDIAEQIDIDESRFLDEFEQLVETGTSKEDARKKVILGVTKNTLQRAKGNEEVAKSALIAVNANPHRVGKAVELFQKHETPVVIAAYRIHEELTDSICSITTICQIIEAVGYVPDEHESEISDMLNAIAKTCGNKRRELFWYKRILELFEERIPLIEAISDYILGEIRNRPDHLGPIISIDEELREEYWESLSSNDQEK